MISLCYNCHKEVVDVFASEYCFAIAELILLVAGVVFALKVGGMPQAAGIAMLSLGGLALMVDFCLFRKLLTDPGFFKVPKHL